MGISRLGFIAGLIWFMAMDWQGLCMAQSNVHRYNFVVSLYFFMLADCFFFFFFLFFFFLFFFNLYLA
jgi:hypothetical protein